MKPVRVLVTRPKAQAQKLVALIEQQGLQAIQFPTLVIAPIALTEQELALLQNLTEFTAVIFISLNAVNFAVNANNGKIAPFTRTHLAAVGPATQQALTALGLTVNVLPGIGADSESLLAQPFFHQLKGKSFLIIRGQGGREVLAETLRARGAQVQYLEVYQRLRPTVDTTELVYLLRHGQLDVVTITSAQALSNLLDMLEQTLHAHLFEISLVVVSARIKQLAQMLGFKRVVVADGPSDKAISDKIMTLI